MANYIIIGGDQKEYGPISEDELRQWIIEGRLNEQSMVKAEGESEFRPLGSYPEFIRAFVASQPIPKLSPAAFGTGSAPEKTDYELDMGGCISRGWELVKNNFGLLFVAALVMMLIEGLISGLGSIPFVGPIFSIANLVIAGPLMGGLYYVFIQTLRGEHAEVGDVFAGFRQAFAQLFLGHLVPALLAGLCLLPFGIIAVIILIPLVAQGNHAQALDPQTIAHAMSATSVTLLIVGLVVCLIPMLYLQTCWAFTLPLIIDKKLDFWTAMGASRKMVRKHWWHVFGLMILIGLLNLAGFCLCCIGALFTLPVGIAALMFAYETIFSEGETA